MVHVIEKYQGELEVHLNPRATQCCQVCLPPFFPVFLPTFLSLSLLLHAPLPCCPIYLGSQLLYDGMMIASNSYVIVYLLINPMRKRDSVFLTAPPHKKPCYWVQLVPTGSQFLFEPCLSHMLTRGSVLLRLHKLRIGDGYF